MGQIGESLILTYALNPEMYFEKDLDLFFLSLADVQRPDDGAPLQDVDRHQQGHHGHAEDQAGRRRHLQVGRREAGGNINKLFCLLSFNVIVKCLDNIQILNSTNPILDRVLIPVFDKRKLFI